jgi:hypothetical protein
MFVRSPCFDALGAEAKDSMKESFVVEQAQPLATQKVANAGMSMV